MRFRFGATVTAPWAMLMALAKASMLSTGCNPYKTAAVEKWVPTGPFTGAVQ